MSTQTELEKVSTFSQMLLWFGKAKGGGLKMKGKLFFPKALFLILWENAFYAPKPPLLPPCPFFFQTTAFGNRVIFRLYIFS